MRPLLKATLLLALALPAVRVGEVPAQRAPLQGTYEYAPQESDDIEQAIRQATARMNFITRPIARSRLKRISLPRQRITISHTPSEVSIGFDAGAPIVSPADGSPGSWRKEDGEVVAVSTVWESGTLRQTLVAGEGQRVNLFRLGPDGDTLIVQVTVSSPRLPQPLVYTLRYRRQDEPGPASPAASGNAERSP